MKKMKLKVPVNSLVSAKCQIKAGADEIYLTFAYGEFANLTFSGRGRQSATGRRTEVSYDDFKEIVKMAHDNGVIVEMVANTYRMTDDYDGGSNINNKYLEYIKMGLDAGADRAIIADIGNIILAKKHFPQLSITASVFLEALNIPYIKLLEQIGVEKIVLDHCVTLNEIEEIISSTSIDIEVFCQLGCSFMQYTCSMHHSTVSRVNLGLPCRAKYKIKGQKTEIPILDTAEDCAICTLPQLMKLGVSSIKVTGRDKDYKFIASITHIYSSILRSIEGDQKIDDIQKELDINYDFDWWRKFFCNQQRCKYKSSKYYV